MEDRQETEEIPSQLEKAEKVSKGHQIHIVGRGNDVTVIPPKMTNVEIREALIFLAWTLTSHVNIGIALTMNVVESTMTY